MGSIFNYDGPIWGSLGKLADLVVLNLLTLLFCIPLVTIGASLTAAHYVALKIRRGEGYVWKNFWKSFKENLKQSTALWLLYVVAIGGSIFAYLMAMNMGGMTGAIISAVVFIVAVFVVMTSVWALPMQSKFINPISATIKNAFLFAFKYLFRTMLMLVINVLPFVIVFFGYQWYCLLLLFGFSIPIYLCAMVYDKKFQEVEDMIMDRQREEEEGLI